MKAEGLLERVQDAFCNYAAGGDSGLTFLGLKRKTVKTYIESLIMADEGSVADVSRPGIVGSLCLAALSAQPKRIERFPVIVGGRS